MKTLDLNVDHRWDELFQTVEAGEVLRVVRGEREITVVRPAGQERPDADMDAWAAEGLRQLTKSSEPGEFADWKQPDGTR